LETGHRLMRMGLVTQLWATGNAMERAPLRPCRHLALGKKPCCLSADSRGAFLGCLQRPSSARCRQWFQMLGDAFLIHFGCRRGLVGFRGCLGKGDSIAGPSACMHLPENSMGSRDHSPREGDMQVPDCLGPLSSPLDVADAHGGIAGKATFIK
jgi:hypothetical protein